MNKCGVSRSLSQDGFLLHLRDDDMFHIFLDYYSATPVCGARAEGKGENEQHAPLPVCLLKPPHHQPPSVHFTWVSFPITPTTHTQGKVRLLPWKQRRGPKFWAAGKPSRSDEAAAVAPFTWRAEERFKSQMRPIFHLAITPCVSRVSLQGVQTWHNEVSIGLHTQQANKKRVKKNKQNKTTTKSQHFLLRVRSNLRPFSLTIAC